MQRAQPQDGTCISRVNSISTANCICQSSPIITVISEITGTFKRIKKDHEKKLNCGLLQWHVMMRDTIYLIFVNAFALIVSIVDISAL